MAAATEWQVSSEAKTQNEFGDQLLRQLRGGSGGGGGGGGYSGGGGSWGGGSKGNGYYYGSSSYNSSSGDGDGEIPMAVVIVVAVLALFGILYCVLSQNKKGNDPGFQAAVNEERDRERSSFTATAHKSTQQTRCGIGLKRLNGSVTITSIDPNGLFANSGLEAGMTIKTINTVPVATSSAAEATEIIKLAVGQVTIVATGGRSTGLDVRGGHPPFETYCGTFDMSYVDRGKQFRGHVILELKNNQRGGYTVTGTTSDADGSAVIIEGLVTHGGDAWWVDEVHSGNDIGLKVLTTGKFDWSTNNFQGAWRSNTGESGRYSSFQATNVSKTFAPVTPAATVVTAPVMTAVVATPVDPSYSQTPIVTAVAESSSPVIVATANKVIKDMSVGIGIKAPDGTPVISSIHPDGLFATSSLRVGMDVQSINNQSMSGKTAGEATQLIKDAVGEIRIVAGWNISVSTPFTGTPMASAPPAETTEEPEVYVPSYR
mmetsp:Transcript_11579/g.17796  ORF Transcript_11579/g.17796 Transcript_11579/m.17796 type:complete len:487 (-) Transcript_11579:411-1871(-)